MSTRNLEYFFAPRSVALVGASATPSSVGATVLANLLGAGFEGPVWPVNPKYEELLGQRCRPDVESLPEAPDLAVIATPARTVPDLIARLGARGTRAAVVISAGFAERPEEGGRELQQAMLDAARPNLLRILGPNTVGLLVPEVGLNASFAHLSPAAGSIAFATQSGAMLTSIMDWAHSRGIGFSRLISLGGMADVDFGDVLDFLASDPATRAILLYVEAITEPRKFMSAARAASRSKPVIVCKAGRHEAGARAAMSHTGALAGSDAVYDCAFRRAGMLRVLTLEELFDAVETLANARPPNGDRLAIVTNGGGVGVMATDRLIDTGGRLAELSDDTRERLDAVLPPTWSHGNPIDIVGDARPARYADTLDIVTAAPEVDATLVLHVPVSVVAPEDAAAVVVDHTARHPDRTLLTSWVGGRSMAAARARFVEARVPTYDSPGDAVQAFAHLVAYRRVQLALLETPSATGDAPEGDRDRARALVAKALAEGRELFDAPAMRAIWSQRTGFRCSACAAAGPPRRPRVPPPTWAGRWRSRCSRPTSRTRPTWAVWCLISKAMTRCSPRRGPCAAGFAASGRTRASRASPWSRCTGGRTVTS
jgi:acetyltransferase